jgi:uncharacterized protein (DUF1684 family)
MHHELASHQGFAPVGWCHERAREITGGAPSTSGGKTRGARLSRSFQATQGFPSAQRRIRRQTVPEFGCEFSPRLGSAGLVAAKRGKQCQAESLKLRQIGDVQLEWLAVSKVAGRPMPSKKYTTLALH